MKIITEQWGCTFYKQQHTPYTNRCCVQRKKMNERNEVEGKKSKNKKKNRANRMHKHISIELSTV